MALSCKAQHSALPYSPAIALGPPRLEVTQMSLRCTFLSEGSQSDLVTDHLIPTIRHSGKGKTIKPGKRSEDLVGAKGLVARGDKQREPRGLLGQQSYSV